MNLSDYIKSVVLNSFAGSPACGIRLRKKIYSLYGHVIEGVVFSQCFLGHGRGMLKLGKGSFINSRSFLDLGSDIIIGENCAIAFGVTFVNSYHLPLSGEGKIYGDTRADIIEIEDGCWVGANVTILPNVHIHKNCIIAAGAVVISDCDANSLYAGVPARKIKTYK